MLINDKTFPHYEIANYIHEYICELFGNSIVLDDYDYDFSSAGMGYFEINYVYLPTRLKVKVEHDRLFLVIYIIDPSINDDNKMYSNSNTVTTMLSQVKNQKMDTGLSVDKVQSQVIALYDILVNNDPKFYPTKRKGRIKNGKIVSYWEEYWEEHS